MDTSSRAARKAHAASTKARPRIGYKRIKGVLWFTRQVSQATPIQLVDVERRGVEGLLIKDLATKMEVPHVHFFRMLGVPKSTVAMKASAGQVISGTGGQAALGVVKLLGVAQGIIDNSTSPDAAGFDVAKWFGRWIERPQPSLGGKKPSEFLDTPTGIEIVARLLGAMESGAYL